MQRRIHRKTKQKKNNYITHRKLKFNCLVFYDHIIVIYVTIEVRNFRKSLSSKLVKTRIYQEPSTSELIVVFSFSKTICVDKYEYESYIMKIDF